MTPELEELYHEIGQYIADTVPQPWNAAWISVEFEDGVVSSRGRYTVDQNSAQHSFLVTGDIGRLFVRLRELIRKNDRSMWVRATFTLQPGGDFRLDFDY